MHQRSVLSPFLSAVVTDVVIEFAREGAPSELLYADELVLMSETIKGLRNKFLKWKKAFENMASESQPWENQGNGLRWYHKGWHA